ncbi:MAG: hypothetical protein J3R72DRAFT_511499, partial [Linnemannia gamsii]
SFLFSPLFFSTPLLSYRKTFVPSPPYHIHRHFRLHAKVTMADNINTTAATTTTTVGVNQNSLPTSTAILFQSTFSPSKEVLPQPSNDTTNNTTTTATAISTTAAADASAASAAAPADTHSVNTICQAASKFDGMKEQIEDHAQTVELLTVWLQDLEVGMAHAAKDVGHDENNDDGEENYLTEDFGAERQLMVVDLMEQDSNDGNTDAGYEGKEADVDKGKEVSRVLML